MAVEGDVDVELLGVNGVLSLPLEHPYPDLVPFLEIKHDALTLHDAPLAGLGIEDDHFVVVLHDVEVGLLVVPGVDVEVEEVDARNVAEELPGEHVEVLVEVDKLRVEGDVLVIVGAVEGFAPTHRKGHVILLAGMAWWASMAFLSFLTIKATETRLTHFPFRSRNPFISHFTFFT